MTLSRAFSALAALAMLGACATATPYQAATSAERGYSDQKIEADRWQIAFSGNSLTDRQTVETYLLFRAAELTTLNGFDYFKVVQRETEADRSLVPVGFASDPYFSHFGCNYRFYGRGGRLHGYPYGFYGSRYAGYNDPFWGGSYEYREIVRYEASSEIVMGKGEKPADPAYFDARDVQFNLAGQIVRPEA